MLSDFADMRKYRLRKGVMNLSSVFDTAVSDPERVDSPIQVDRLL